MKYAWALILVSGCGYKTVKWHEADARSLFIAPVSASSGTAPLSARLRDALRERCLTKTTLVPVNRLPSDYALEVHIDSYEESVVATDVDGRTRRIQFSIRASFKLIDAEGATLWHLPAYQYADQFQLSTTRVGYRDESHLVQDEALKSVADLVMTNIVIALMETPQL